MCGDCGCEGGACATTLLRVCTHAHTVSLISFFMGCHIVLSSNRLRPRLQAYSPHSSLDHNSVFILNSGRGRLVTIRSCVEGGGMEEGDQEWLKWVSVGRKGGGAQGRGTSLSGTP